MEFLSRQDFAGLGQLRKLDLSYNRLRSIEDGSLGSLQSLQEIDLSGNDWSCDCYMRPLKEFLDNNPYHKGQREQLVCGGDEMAGEMIDFIHDDKMKCPDVGFNVTLDNEQGQAAATVWWNQPATFAPPFVQWRLKLSIFTSDGKSLLFRVRKQSVNITSNVELEDVREVNVYTPLEHTLTGLHFDVKYRVCLYNGYYWLQSDSTYCKDFIIPSTPGPLNDVTQYAVAEEADDLETIIGLLTGALIVILSLIIVAVLFWRSNRFANNKDHQPQGNNHYYFTNPVLSPA